MLSDDVYVMSMLMCFPGEKRNNYFNNDVA